MTLQSSRRDAVRRPRFKTLFLLATLMLLVGLVWFAPTIIVNSPLKQQIIASATSGFGGQISIGAASAGWLSPIVIRDVVATDEAGEPILTAASISTQKSLGRLMTDQSRLGVLRIEQPRVVVAIDQQSSNIERALESLLADTTESAGVAGAVEIVEGAVEFRDIVSGKSWNVEQLNVTCAFDTSDTAGPINARFTSTVRSPVVQPSAIEGELVWETKGNAAESGNQLMLRMNALPLDILEPVLRRTGTFAQIAGILAGEIQVSWGPTGELITANGIRADQLYIAAPSILGNDQLVIQSLTGQGSIARHGNNWSLQNVTVDSDIFDLRASGEVYAANGETRQQGILASLLQQGTYQISGNVDLARLAPMLPQTLRLRESTHLASGSVFVSLESSASPDGNVWKAVAQGSQLAGMHQGKPVQLEQPIDLSVTAHRHQDMITIDQIACQSSFINVIGRGSLAQGDAQADVDLTHFVAEAGKFVDFGDLRLGGQLKGNLNWQLGAQGQISFNGNAVAQQFEMTIADGTQWREERLQVDVSALGMKQIGQPLAIQQASVIVESAGDRLDAELVQPVSPISTAATWPLRAHLEGELNTWLPRLQHLLPITGLSLSGQINSDLEATISSNRIEIASAKASIKDLSVQNAAFDINEPVVEIETAATWDGATSQIVSPVTTLATSALAFRADRIQVITLPDQFSMAGDISYRADLMRLAGWTQQAKSSTQAFQGQATGDFQLAVQNGTTRATWTSDIKDFAFAKRASNGVIRSASASDNWQPIWQEPLFKLKGDAFYEPQEQLLTFDRLEAAGESLSVGAKGRISQILTRCFTELEGELAYDLQRLTAKLQPYTGSQLKVTGTDSRPFVFRGPLLADASQNQSANVHPASTTTRGGSSQSILPELLAQVSLGWSSADFEGFKIGPGELDTQLKDGILSAAPMELAVSEGTMRLTPRVLLNRPSPVFQLASGRIAEQVTISPRMCRTWLKYVAPLLADATSADGRFSIDLEACSLPVSAPVTGEVKGTFTVHSARIGPGPLAQQIIWIGETVQGIADGTALTRQPSSLSGWLDVPEQRVPVHLANGRVHHANLQVNVKDVLIRTSGSVGLDESISMTAEVPIRDEWVSRNRYLSALKGQVLRVPIQGTLSKPRVDRRIFEQLTRQAVSGAANRLIEEEIGRGLDKLFGPRP